MDHVQVQIMDDQVDDHDYDVMQIHMLLMQIDVWLF
jgi:hypothetical protein